MSKISVTEELSVKRQILSIGQKFFFWPKLFFGTNSSIPLLWLSSEKWIECLLLRNIDLFFQGHFQCFGEKANFDHLDKFAFLDSSCRKKNIFLWLKLIFGIKSSIPLLWLSSEKWIDCKLMRDKNSSFYTFFNVSVKRQILAQNLPKFAFSKRQILSLFTNLVSH